MMSGSVTAIREADFTYIWKIENFSYCVQQSDDSLYSSPFFTEYLNKTFRLSLCPRKENEKHIAFHLSWEKGYLPATQYELSFLAADGSVLQAFDGDIKAQDYRIASCTGTSTFVTREEVFRRNRDVFMPRDTLTTRCRMWCIDNKREMPGTYGLYYSSRIAVDRMCFVWTIKEFCTLLKITKCMVLNSGEFRIVVFISDSAVSENAVQVQIIQTNATAKTFSTCRISVLDDKGEKCFYACAEHFFLQEVEEQLWHFPTQLTEKQLLAKKCLLGSLRLEIAVSDGHVSNEIKNLCSMKTSIVSTCISSNLLTDDLHCLYRDRKFCDATLQSGNASFPVHKNVLSARSPMFCAMFENSMKECQTASVHIPDLDKETVDGMLTFLYTDTLEDTLQWELVKKLFYAADKYAIQSLRSKILPFLKAELSISNACDILVLADTHHDDELLGTVLDFIVKNKDIFNSDGWKDLEKNNPKMMNKVYRRMIL